jgi:hypothetical protein
MVGVSISRRFDGRMVGLIKSSSSLIDVAQKNGGEVNVFIDREKKGGILNDRGNDNNVNIHTATTITYNPNVLS